MEQLVVVGNGMAGVACVEQILRHSRKFEITIFGDETHVTPFDKLIFATGSSPFIPSIEADVAACVESFAVRVQDGVVLLAMPARTQKGHLHKEQEHTCGR